MPERDREGLSVKPLRKPPSPARTEAERAAKQVEEKDDKAEKRLNVEILEEMHTWLSVEAKKQRKSLKIIVEDMLLNYVKEHDPDRGKEYAIRIAEIRERKGK